MVVALLFGVIATATAANSFYAEKSVILPGTTGEIEFLLESDQLTYGLQAEIQLPAGLEFVLNDADNVDLTLSDRAGDFSIVSKLTSANSLTLGLLSVNHSAFEGNEGVIFTVKVKASEDFAGGDIIISDAQLTNGKHTDIPLAETSTEIMNRYAVESISLNKISEE